MSLLGGSISITGVTFMLFCVFAIAVIGYGLGRISIKGVNLGTAGVFIVALLFGCFFFPQLEEQLMVKGSAETVAYVDNALKVIESFGLILFVTAVGFMLHSYLPPSAYDLYAKLVTAKTGRSFSVIKTTYDMASLLVAVVLS